MTDEEYIRRAVKLADGWSISNKGVLTTAHNGYFGQINDIEIIDALAAQLIRQVDASERGNFYFVSSATKVQWKYENSDSLDASHVKSNNRTMNAVKAIIDSGVLDVADD